MHSMLVEKAVYTVDTFKDRTGITAVIDGVTMSVPLDPNNRHYAEIMRQVEAGELTIQEATN